MLHCFPLKNIKSLSLWFGAWCCFLAFSLTTHAQNGCRQGDCKNGFGVYHFSTGDRYEGNWENSMMHGFGKWMGKNGDSYEGEFAEDVENGLGAFYWADGYFYAGQFSEGLKNGYGTEYNDEGLVNALGKWENEVLIKDFSDSDGIYQFQKMGVWFTGIVGGKEQSFKNLKGTPIKSPLTGKQAWASSTELPGFEKQWITGEGRFQGLMGSYENLPKHQFYGLATIVISWAAHTGFLWTVEEDESEEAPSFVFTLISSNSAETNDWEGLIIKVYLLHAGDYKLILEIA